MEYRDNLGNIYKKEHHMIYTRTTLSKACLLSIIVVFFKNETIFALTPEEASQKKISAAATLLADVTGLTVASYTAIKSAQYIPEAYDLMKNSHATYKKSQKNMLKVQGHFQKFSKYLPEFIISCLDETLAQKKFHANRKTFLTFSGLTAFSALGTLGFGKRIKDDILHEKID